MTWCGNVPVGVSTSEYTSGSVSEPWVELRAHRSPFCLIRSHNLGVLGLPVPAALILMLVLRPCGDEAADFAGSRTSLGVSSDDEAGKPRLWSS